MERGDLEREARAMGLEVGAEAWERLEKLVELYLRFGRAAGASGARRRAEVWSHVAEGLLTWGCAVKGGAGGNGARWLDVGSGGGFPGLVLAALREGTGEVELVEPRLRRVAFLELACGAMGCRGARVVRGRLEEGGVAVEGGGMRAGGVRAGEMGGGEEGFDAVGARAVFSPAVWRARGEGLVRPGGFVLVHGTAGAGADVVLEGWGWRVEGWVRRG